jgi:hypothetical protein
MAAHLRGKQPRSGEVNLLQGMTMRARLLWAFGVVIALTCALGGMAIMQLGKVQDSVVEIGENWLPSVRVAGALRTAASDYRRNQLAHVLATETPTWTGWKEKCAKRGAWTRCARNTSR